MLSGLLAIALKRERSILILDTYFVTVLLNIASKYFFNAYTPSWFKVTAALKINEYYKKDLYAKIYMGSEMQNKSDECIGGVTFERGNTYYIHQTNQIYNILLPQSFIELPNFCTKCFIVDINDKHIYFGFFPQ